MADDDNDIAVQMEMKRSELTEGSNAGMTATKHGYNLVDHKLELYGVKKK